VLGLGREVPEVREAEDAISSYHGGRHVLATGSGHSSLQLALAGLDIVEGDEVITTPPPTQKNQSHHQVDCRPSPAADACTASGSRLSSDCCTMDQASISTPPDAEMM